MEKRVIDFSSEFDKLNNDLYQVTENKDVVCSHICDTRQDIDNLINEINNFISQNDIPIERIKTDNSNINLLKKFNNDFHSCIKDCVKNVSTFPELATLDVIMCCTSGAIATAIDILLVGKPKIKYPNQEFEGSFLTGLLRKINGDSDFFKFFSQKCKVPYDLSSLAEVVYPNNHRLRSLAHDPLFGLIFAVIDIILGTTTCIDDNGFIEMIPNKKTSMVDKFFSVFLYLGHLISDVCTSRGLPIPGWFLTQLNFNNVFLKKISDLSEKMYINGYDLRHLLSMSSSVAVSHLIIDFYLEITQDKVGNDKLMFERDLQEVHNNLKKAEMMLLTDSIASIGNAVKIFSPPDSGNPTAINLVQWFSFAHDGIVALEAKNRLKNAEIVIENRKIINSNWEYLLDI